MDNIIQGVAKQVNGSYIVECNLGTFPLPQPALGEITFLPRPDAVSLGEGGNSHLRGRVARQSFRGSACRLTVDFNQTLLTFEFSSNLNIPKVGEMVTIGFDPEDAIKGFF
jgi:ABC-type Fe3+/spermidine/putrescine transport system ATPase subunit